MSIFRIGNFILHSGKPSKFKIDCDGLTDEDWQTLGKLITSKLKFREVISIPNGGDKLATVLANSATHNHNDPLLIVDDVLTTGNSMQKARKEYGDRDTVGIVVFARGQCPWWVLAILSFNNAFDEETLDEPKQ